MVSVIRTNHSLFQYTVVGGGGNATEYGDTLLQNCWVEEILVVASESLDAVLPTQFGFYPKAKVPFLSLPISFSRAL
jgi:hypothetical protein